MYPGCYRFLKGTNIEVGIWKLARNVRSKHKQNNVVWAIVRQGKRYAPFLKKTKHNEMLPSDPKRLIRQDIPVELLTETCDFTLKGKPKFDIHVGTPCAPKYDILNEMQWTTLNIDDPAYHKETYYTKKNNKYIAMYRYNRKPRPYTSARSLYIHGLRQFLYPVSTVQDNIVTFNTKPIIRAHIGVCRTKPTKTHLYCNKNRGFKGYNTKGCEWFNSGFVKDTTIEVCVLWEEPRGKPTWVLCCLRHQHIKELVWLPTELIQQDRPHVELSDADDQQVYIHGRIPAITAGSAVKYFSSKIYAEALPHTMHKTRIPDTPEHARIKQHIMRDIQQRHTLNKTIAAY